MSLSHTYSILQQEKKSLSWSFRFFLVSFFLEFLFFLSYLWLTEWSAKHFFQWSSHELGQHELIFWIVLLRLPVLLRAPRISSSWSDFSLNCLTNCWGPSNFAFQFAAKFFLLTGDWASMEVFGVDAVRHISFQHFCSSANHESLLVNNLYRYKEAILISLSLPCRFLFSQFNNWVIPVVSGMVKKKHMCFHSRKLWTS